jgi:predicted alpha/beta superfamily hydrolase
MKRFFALLIALMVLVVTALWIWTESESRASQAAAEANIKRMQQQKLVPVTFVVTVPADTPPDQLLYLSGSAPSLGAWDAAGAPLARRDDGKYVGTVELMTGLEHLFKVTRGTWGTVENAADGTELPNRSVVVEKENQSVDVTVARWVDEGKAVPGRITLTGDVRQHKKFHSNILNNDRTIMVWLPPGYQEGEGAVRYPVLYMQDGNNLMDESQSFAGIEWKMDETAQRLVRDEKIRPLIIVGVYNSEWRDQEFTPSPGTVKGKPAKGELYSRFLVEEVKPFIDRVYNTLPEREHTSIGGASMGGLITLFTIKNFRDTFSSAALFSPWLRVEGKHIADTWGDASFLSGVKLYIDMGDAGAHNYPGDKPMEDAAGLVKWLEAAGLKKDVDFSFEPVLGAEHIEAEFQKRVEPALLRLFGQS